MEAGSAAAVRDLRHRRDGNYSRPCLIETLDPTAGCWSRSRSSANRSRCRLGAKHRINAGPGRPASAAATCGPAAGEPDAGARERRRRQPGVRRAGRGARDPRPRARPHADPDRRRARHLRAAGRPERHLSRSVVDRRRRRARGPGSVAYGSDAFGGVISVRTRRVAPGSPLRVQSAAPSAAAAFPNAARSKLSKGLRAGGVLFAAHARRRRLDSPDGEVFNSGYADHGFLVASTRRPGAGSSARLAERLRPRHRAAAQQLARPSASTIPTRTRTASPPATKPRDVGGLDASASPGSLGTYDQRTDQDRFATATTGRSIERADVAPTTSTCAASARSCLPARSSSASTSTAASASTPSTISITYDLAGDIVSTRPKRVDRHAHRTDTGRLRRGETRGRADALVGGGIRGDYVTTRTPAGTSAIARRATAPARALRRSRSAASAASASPAQIARGFRDPVLSDRYYRGPIGRGFITGNPDLEPETSLQFDLACATWRRRSAPGRVLLPLRHRRPDRALPDADRLSSSSATAARRACAASRSRRRPRFPGAFTLDSPAQVAEGRALDDNALSRRHLADQRHRRAPQAVRRARVRTAARRLFSTTITSVRPSAPSRLHAGRRRRRLSVARPLELRVQATKPAERDLLASQDVRTVLAPGRSWRWSHGLSIYCSNSRR